MKILFITSTRIGDAVLSTGILNDLIQKHEHAEITVVCGALPASMFTGFPKVSEVVALKKEKRHGHWAKLWKRVYKTKWDIVVDLRNSVVSRLIRTKQRYVFGNHIDKNRHKVEQAAEIMKLSQVPSPTLYFTDEQQDFADKIIGTYQGVIGIGPSANWIGKTWHADNFIEVLKWLRSSGGPYPDAPVAIFTAPSEEAQAQPLLESIPESKRIDVIAKGDVGQVAACLSRCQFYLGNDSGLMHMAAASNVRTVGVFGPSYPHLYAPWGAHTSYASTPETFDELIDFEGYSAGSLDKSLMDSLKTQQVIDIIKQAVQISDAISNNNQREN